MEGSLVANEEKSNWIMLVLAVVSATTYVIWGLSSGQYVIPMLATIGGSIVLSILLHISVAPRIGKRDVRERDIHRFGEYTGFGFITAGAVAALILAMLDVDGFWIANAVYAAFVLSAIVGSIAKLVAYRTGLPQW